MKYILLLLVFTKEFAGAQISKPAYFADRESITCITQTKLFEYYPLDSIFQLVKKPAILHFIASIQECGYGYRYNSRFEDKPCQLLLPRWFNGYSMCFGDNDFILSFDDRDTTSGTCIVLHFDLANAYRQFFFQQVEGGCTQYDSIHHEGKILYHFRNDKSVYSGEIFLDTNFSIAYYTNDPKKVELLQTCILSCRIE